MLFMLFFLHLFSAVGNQSAGDAPEFVLRPGERRAEGFERTLLRREAQRFETGRDLRAPVARRHDLRDTLRERAGTRRNPVADEFILVAQTVVVRGVLEKRLFEGEVAHLLDRVEPQA